MARSRGGARSSAPRAAPRAAPRLSPSSSQSRGYSTATTYPNKTQAPPANVASNPQTQTKQPGLFANMASTAAGVAVGSTIGHTLGAGLTSMFGGSSAPAEQPQVQQSSFQQESNRSCETDARSFTKCLEENNGNMQICDFYLQQLKACQEASSQY